MTRLTRSARDEMDLDTAPPPKPATVDLACLTGIPVEMLRAYLRAAASVGNVDAIKAVLISDPLVIDSGDSSGWTALHHAARHGQMGACAALLQRGAKVNSRTADGSTPLHLACKKDHALVVKVRAR